MQCHVAKKRGLVINHIGCPNCATSGTKNSLGRKKKAFSMVVAVFIVSIYRSRAGNESIGKVPKIWLNR